MSWKKSSRSVLISVWEESISSIPHYTISLGRGGGGEGIFILSGHLFVSSLNCLMPAHDEQRKNILLLKKKRKLKENHHYLFYLGNRILVDPYMHTKS